jgi:monoamine oxidase
MSAARVDAMRRALLLAGAGLPLAACRARRELAYEGGWIGADAVLGHRLRDGAFANASLRALPRRASVVVVGAGIAGLGAARALMRAGVDDVHVLDLEAEPGGNSRGHAIGGIGCPLGAHYLPVPGDSAVEVVELLEDLGLRRTERGAPAYDERTLCHTPQERLWIDGVWHDGLLPPVDALPAQERAVARDDYGRFAARVAALGVRGAFAIPTARATWTPVHAALDAVTFARWLDDEGLRAPALRWYLDYCCRDDYGAGAAQVSAWAGIHYFASRHGFRAPGEGGEERDGVLTWPEGNGWLARRLAAALGARWHASTIGWRVEEAAHGVTVDAWNAQEQRAERWSCEHAILAVPLFVAARILVSPPPALSEASGRVAHAPWLVANLRLEAPLDDRPGAPLAWDNVAYRSPSLGYVDAGHQSLLPYAGPTVLTAYWALGGDDDGALRVNRRRLFDATWREWADRVLEDLAPLHPDLASRVTRIDAMRYGHAMAIPRPGVRASAALQALAEANGRVQFAHADLSGYSVFEEALYHGTRAARVVANRLRTAAG